MRRSTRLRIKVQEDRISELPDDILVSIISKLPLKDALLTSILSARWRNLCTFTTHLNFPPFLLVNNKRKNKKRKKKDSDGDGDDVEARFSSYVNMVDRTLDSHKGDRVKEFRLNAYCLKGASLEKWLVFALSKQAQVIEINMKSIRFSLFGKSFNCTYSLGFKSLMSKGINSNLECLKQLCLCGVGASDDDLALLVSTCVALESLSIREGGDLEKVSIVGHSSLKHLEISGVGYFIRQSVEVRDMPNLVSFECYLYGGCSLRLENVPKLVEFSSGERRIGMSVREVLSKMPSSVRHQLQLLRLSTILSIDVLYSTSITQPSRCENAKCLELELVDLEDEPQYVSEMFPRFIALYPMLQKLKIKMSWDDRPGRSRRRSLLRKPIRKFIYFGKYQLSPVLKELEIEGYSIYLGSRSVLELASYIIQHSVGTPLEHVVVKPYRDSADDKSRVGVHNDFRPIIPDSVNFKII